MVRLWLADGGLKGYCSQDSETALLPTNTSGPLGGALPTNRYSKSQPRHFIQVAILTIVFTFCFCFHVFAYSCFHAHHARWRWFHSLECRLGSASTLKCPTAEEIMFSLSRKCQVQTKVKHQANLPVWSETARNGILSKSEFTGCTWSKTVRFRIRCVLSRSDMASKRGMKF